MTYFSDTQVQAMDENNIYELLPNYSCKRIQEM